MVLPTQPFDPVLELSDLIVSAEAEPIAAFLRELPPEETPYTIPHPDDDHRTALFALLAESEPEFAADPLEHFDDAPAADIVNELEPEAAAATADERDSDETAGGLRQPPAHAIQDPRRRHRQTNAGPL